MKSTVFSALAQKSHSLDATQTQNLEAELEQGIFSRLRKRMTNRTKARYKTVDLHKASVTLFLLTMRQIDHDLFMKELELPDTFNSWFKITELHIWMFLLRLAKEGEDGKIVSKKLIEIMWEDSENRVKQLGRISFNLKKKGFEILLGQFRAALFMYDEAILSDDKALANALWIQMFNQQCEDPQKLELLVRYVRKQVKFLDLNNSKEILENGIVAWLPLHGEKLDKFEFQNLIVALHEDMGGPISNARTYFRETYNWVKGKSDSKS